MYSYPTNITNLAGLALWANSVTGSLFWPLILLGLFAIMFFSLKNYPMERSFATSSFVTAIIGIMFYLIGLVSAYIVVGIMVVTAISVIVLRNSNNREY